MESDPFITQIMKYRHASLIDIRFIQRLPSYKEFWSLRCTFIVLWEISSNITFLIFHIWGGRLCIITLPREIMCIVHVSSRCLKKCNFFWKEFTLIPCKVAVKGITTLGKKQSGISVNRKKTCRFNGINGIGILYGWMKTKDNSVNRLNIRVRLCSHHLSFHLTFHSTQNRSFQVKSPNNHATLQLIFLSIDHDKTNTHVQSIYCIIFDENLIEKVHITQICICVLRPIGFGKCMKNIYRL